MWSAEAIAGRLHGLDIVTWYATSRVVLQNGPGAMYDLALQRSAQAAVAAPYGAQPFLPDLFPPFVIAGRAWLALLPIRAAFAAWLLVNAVVLFVALLLLVQAAGLRGRRRWAAVLAGAGSVPAVVDLLQGQPVAFVLLGIAAAALLLARRPASAGAALALVLVKPHIGAAAFVVPPARGWWRVTAGLAVATAVLAAISVALVGVRGIVRYVQLLGGETTAPPGSDVLQHYALTLRAPLVAAGLPGWAQLAVLGLLLLGVLAAIDLVPGPGGRDLAAATMASLLLSPHLNVHDLALLAAPGILLAARLWERPDPLGWAALGATAAAATVAPYLPWAMPLAELGLLAYLLVRWTSEAPSPNA